MTSVLRRAWCAHRARGGRSPPPVRGARRVIRWPALAVVGTVVAVGLPDPGRALAGTGRAELSVSLVVPPAAVLRVEHQSPELRLTDVDIARGYVDVPEGSRLAVRTTSRAGYLLEFHARVPLFTSVSVTSPVGHGEFGRDGGTLVARGALDRRAVTPLSYRFHLDANVRAGAYPWPLAVSVRPL